MQGGIAAKRYYRGSILTDLENVPLIASVVSCFFLLIYLVFSFATTSLSLPIIGKLFGVSFYLDTLNAFCLFCVFLCGGLFVFFKRSLGCSHYFLLPYVNVLLLLLSGNLYFFTGLLSVLILMTYGLSVGRSLSPFIALASLLIAVVLLPGQVGDKGNFAPLSFDVLRQSSFSPVILFFILVTSCVLIGLMPFSQWRMNISRQGKGDAVYSFMHLLLSMTGIYLLLRFYVDLGRNSETLLLSFIVEVIGMFAACYAGWQSLVVKTFQERISCLYVLSNGVLVQTIGMMTFFIVPEQQEWFSFANDILGYGVFIQFIGFTFVFLLSNFLKETQKNQETEVISAPVLISLLLLSFLLSGLPPFAGFSVLWGNLQLLLAMPSGHHLVETLLTTMLIGFNAVILVLSLLGWMRTILTGGIASLQKAVYELPDYFSSKMFVEVKVGIAFLFIIALLPGFIFLLVRSVPTNVMGLSETSHSFFSFSLVGQQARLMPWMIALLFTLIVMIVGWIARRERKKAPTFSLRDSCAETTHHHSVVEETSFSFGQASFQAMLERHFSFINALTTVNYTIGKYWLLIKKRCLKYTHVLNVFLWQYQNACLLLMIALVLLSISLIAR